MSPFDRGSEREGRKEGEEGREEEGVKVGGRVEGRGTKKEHIKNSQDKHTHVGTGFHVSHTPPTGTIHISCTTPFPLHTI